MAETGIGLLLGVAVGLLFGNPYIVRTRKLAHALLALSVIGLGAGMDLRAVLRAGSDGVLLTVLGITTCLGVGLVLARFLKVGSNVALLVSIGTAICGGSAIAAVAPVLRPRDDEVSVALATVFLLNAIALFVFPVLGHAAHLDQHHFGLWAALAIHDTSSVVGASMAYGKEALEVATTVKLARALWIVPVTIGVGMVMARRRPIGAVAPKAKKPWFIAGFVLAAALVTFVPALRPLGDAVSSLAKHALAVTLFLIGAGLTRPALRAVGTRPLVHGAALWLFMSVFSLILVMRLD
jgi:uncharacterized integral membrane protein (TIGR00698 family)